MELFLNLCWLSLLLPAFLIGRRAAYFAGKSTSARDRRPLLLVAGILGCAMVLLFPVISVTDDLNAMRPEMEESERAFRDSGRNTGAIQAPDHTVQGPIPTNVELSPAFEQTGTVALLAPPILPSFSTPPPAGRAPPVGSAAVL